VRARWLLVPPLIAALSACSFDFQIGQAAGTGTPAPMCSMPDGQTAGRLVLMAQSVPTALELPCLRQLPEGWSVGGFSARKGRSRIWLVVGHENRTALNVILQRSCDLDGYLEGQSDVVGAARFDRLFDTVTGLRGSRAYVYPGSCLRFDYTLFDASALPVMNTAIGTVARALVAARVADDSDGELHLDPVSGT
jgi:hypothetical protein